MEISDRSALTAAMKHITARTGVAFPVEVAEAHIRGNLKTMCTYNSLRGAMPDIHPLSATSRWTAVPVSLFRPALRCTASDRTGPVGTEA